MRLNLTIPFGLCQCGCGQKTTVITPDSERAKKVPNSWIGVPRYFIQGHHARGKPIEESFWSKVQKTDGCWIWTGQTRTGYGRLKIKGRFVMASHISWQIHFGPVPSGMHVLHHCDNPICVRPDHLFLGTPLDNARDRDHKERRQWIGRKGPDGRFIPS